eukprot:Partr_v1_DN28017_c0_g1_i3_m56756
MDPTQGIMRYILDWGAASPIHHIRLINRVYPTNPTEKSVPRANKLSTLMFYANSRPAKLVKISRYLAYKIQLDVTLNNHGRNKISIDILNAILSSSRNFMHLFALDFLKIIRLLLDGDDHALIVSGAADAFIQYCVAARHDEIYYIHDELMRALNRILGRLTVLSKTQLSNEKKDAVKQYEIQSAGLRGLQALASMETFRGFGVARRMEDFWEAAFYNMPFTDTIKVSAGNRLPRHTSIVKRSLLSEDVITFESTSSLALRCLQTLLSHTTATTIPVVMEPFFRAVLDQETNNVDLAIRITDAIIPTLETRQAFLLVNQILEFVRLQIRDPRGAAILLRVAPLVVKTEKLANFPVAALLEPILTLASKSEMFAGENDQIASFLVLIASSPHFSLQIPHAISLLIQKAMNVSTHDVELMLIPISFAVQILEKTPREFQMRAIELEELRNVVHLVTIDGAVPRLQCLTLISLIIKRSRGLDVYGTLFVQVMDLLYGGLICNSAKFGNDFKAELMLSRCLVALLTDERSIITALPHVITLLSEPADTLSINKLCKIILVVNRIGKLLDISAFGNILKAHDISRGILEAFEQSPERASVHLTELTENA